MDNSEAIHTEVPDSEHSDDDSPVKSRQRSSSSSSSSSSSRKSRSRSRSKSKSTPYQPIDVSKSKPEEFQDTTSIVSSETSTAAKESSADPNKSHFQSSISRKLIEISTQDTHRSCSSSPERKNFKQIKKSRSRSRSRHRRPDKGKSRRSGSRQRHSHRSRSPQKSRSSRDHKSSYHRRKRSRSKGRRSGSRDASIEEVRRKKRRDSGSPKKSKYAPDRSKTKHSSRESSVSDAEAKKMPRLSPQPPVLDSKDVDMSKRRAHNSGNESSNSPDASTEQSNDANANRDRLLNTISDNAQDKSRSKEFPSDKISAGESSIEKSRRRGSPREKQSRREKSPYRHRKESSNDKSRRRESSSDKPRHRRPSGDKSRHRNSSRDRSRHRKRSPTGSKNRRSHDKPRSHSRSPSRKWKRSLSKSSEKLTGRNRRSRTKSRTRSVSPTRTTNQTFRQKLKAQLLKSSKILTHQDELNKALHGDKAVPSEGPKEKPSNLPLIQLDSCMVEKLSNMPPGQVLPQLALFQQMSAMHQKVQEITGVSVPKYYNQAAVNPLKYAETIKKRKMLWSKKPEVAETVPSGDQWKGTAFAADDDGKVAAKFRKLMGIKEEGGVDESSVEEQQKKRDELFQRLDQEYAFARMTTHTQRGVGFGFQKQGCIDPNIPRTSAPTDTSNKPIS